LGFIYQGKLIAQGSPAVIKSETFRRPVIEVEITDLRRASDLLTDWDAVEEVVRIGTRLRAVLGPEGAGAPEAGQFLPRAGLRPRWVHEVEPSVEDLFVSFVDKERKARLREQLRALATDVSVVPGERGGEGGVGPRLIRLIVKEVIHPQRDKHALLPAPLGPRGRALIFRSAI